MVKFLIKDQDSKVLLEVPNFDPYEVDEKMEENFRSVIEGRQAVKYEVFLKEGTSASVFDVDNGIEDDQVAEVVAWVK